jgi:hypothetical protein
MPLRRCSRPKRKSSPNRSFWNGCPVAAVTPHVASTVEELREPCAEAFDLWIETFAGGLAATGLPAKDVRALASYVLSSLEGAIVLSRAEKSVTAPERTAAFDSVTAAVTFQTVTIRECRSG